MDSSENEKNPSPSFKRRNRDEVLEVCPHCFSLLKRSPRIFDLSQNFQCTNKECGWTGAFAIEVDKDDYEEFMKKHAP